MKSVRRLAALAWCALFALPAWSAIELENNVAYARGAQPDDASCAWEPGMVSAAVTRSKGAIAQADKPQPDAQAVRLSLEVTRLKVTRKASKGEYLVVVRGNIVRNGKLLATRDFQDDASFKDDKPACDALRRLGAEFGHAVSDWATRTSLMECGDTCTGIHPDETIVVGVEVLMGRPDAINDTVRNECRWPKLMVDRLLEAYNEIDDPQPRARLEARPIDIESYTGRRLLLRVQDVHALGGGGFSGPKWMNMTGELRDGNAVVATFNSYTTSGRGLSTCRSVDSLTDSSVSMIVEWLRSPTMGAQLR